jgi:autotransporter-associated beta strand protein
MRGQRHEENPSSRSARRVLALSAAAAAAAALLLHAEARANTQVVVPNGTTDLTSLAAGLASDLTFTNQAYNPTAFTVNTGLSIGTLDDLDGTQTLTIANAGGAADTLTLNGGTNSAAPATADLLAVASGGTLTLTGGTGAASLGLSLAASGNFDVAGTANVGSVISGAFGIEKTGAGTLNLTGANTFSNGLTVGAGTVVGDVNGGSLTSTFGTGTITLGDAAIGGNATVAEAGFGVNANPITVAAGSGGRTLSTLSLLSGQSPTFSGGVTLFNSLTLSAASGGSLRMSGNIADGSGSNGLIVNSAGAGVVRLSGANTFSGGVVIQQGTLELYGSNTAAGAGPITIGNSTGTANATLLTNAGAVTAANPITVASGNSGTASIANANGSPTTYTGPVSLNNNLTLNSSGAGGLTLSGAITGGVTATLTNAGTSTGQVTLSGPITSAGGTVGLVQNSATSQLAVTDRVNLAIGSVVVRAGTFYFNPTVGTDGAYNIANPITLGDSTLNANATLNFGYRSGTSAAGTINVLGSGADTLIFSHFNSGQISILAGPITLNSNTLDLQVTGTSGARITGGLSGTGNVLVNSTSGDTTNGVSLRSAINNGGTVTNQGAGTASVAEVSGLGTFGANVTRLVENSATSPFTLGNTNPAFVGGVEVDQGSFVVTTTGALNANNAVSVASGATFDVRNVAQTVAGLNDVVAGAGGTVTDTTATAVQVLTLGGSGTCSYDGTITAATPADMALTVNLASAGVQALSGTNAYTGATTVSGGTLRLGNTGALSTSAVTVSGGTLDVNGNSISNALAVTGTGAGGNGALVNSNASSGATLNSEITNGASFTVGGAGALTLQRARSGGGPFTLTKVGSGTLTLGNGNATGADNLLALDVESVSTVNLGMTGSTIAIDRGLKVAAGGTVAFTGTSTNMITSGSEVIVSNGTLNVNAISDAIGNLTIGDGTNNGTLNGSGTLTVDSSGTNTYSLFGTNNQSAAFGAINAESGTVALVLAGGAAFTKSTAGTVTLNNGNTYAGATTINAGTLAVGPFAGITVSPTITVASGATFNTSAKGAAGFNVLGAQSVVNSGTLTGSLTATGTVLNNGTISGQVNVNAGGVLAGTGTVASVYVTGGTITAGSGSSAAGTPGVLTTTVAQNWSSGSFVDKVAATTGGPGVGNDLLLMSSLNITGAFNLNVLTSNGSSPSLAPGAVLVLAVDEDTSSGNPFNSSAAAFTTLTSNLTVQVNGAAPSGLTYGTQADTTGSGGFDLVLQSTAAAPEPTSLLMAGLAAIPLVLGRRRRRRCVA